MKIKKRKKKAKSNLGLSIFIFCVAVIAEIIASLFCGTINVSLTYDIQTKQNRIAELKEENSKLTIKISELEGKERVYETASAAGLSQNQKNVIYVGN